MTLANTTSQFGIAHRKENSELLWSFLCWIEKDDKQGFELAASLG